jgi:hypothetical protein
MYDGLSRLFGVLPKPGKDFELLIPVAQMRLIQKILVTKIII